MLMGWGGVGGLTTLMCGGVHADGDGVGWGGVGGLTTLKCGGVAAVKECVGVRRARVYGPTERCFLGQKTLLNYP